MLLKKSLWKYGASLVLGIIGVFAAIFSGKAFVTALGQPHLESSVKIYYFQGYYIMSAIYLGLFLLCVGAAVFIILKSGRKKSP